MLEAADAEALDAAVLDAAADDADALGAAELAEASVDALDAEALAEAADVLAAALEAADEEAALDADWELLPHPTRTRATARAATAKHAMIFLLNIFNSILPVSPGPTCAEHVPFLLPR